MSQLSSEQEIHPNLIRAWKGQLLEDRPNLFATNGERKQREQEAQEIERYEQSERLKMALARLKKKLPAAVHERRRMVDSQHAVLPVRRQQQLGPDAASFLLEYCSEIRNEFEQLQHTPEFSIPVEYRLVLTKRQDDADIALASGPSERELAKVLETPRDPGKTHPFRQREVVSEVNRALQIDINIYDIQCIDRVIRLSPRGFSFSRG